MELSELKEQNAKEEADKLAAESLQAGQIIPPEDGDDDPGQLDDDGNPVVTVEPWMQEEEDGEQTPDDPSKSVPVGKFVSLKKELRGKIEDRDKELEKLRSENEALRLATPKTTPSLKRPNIGDFNYDEEYEFAVSKYDEDRLQETYNRNRKREQQEADQRQAQEAINQAMDAHYEQADELIKSTANLPEKNRITKEKYKAASGNTKAVFEELFGKGAESVFDSVFSKLGKGSEKIEYFVGVNKVAQNKIKELIKSDPHGISLAMWLGQQKQRLIKPTNHRSNAPDPARSVKGEVATGSIGKYKKKYDSAKSPQEAYDIKKAAKAAKVDVSSW